MWLTYTQFVKVDWDLWIDVHEDFLNVCDTRKNRRDKGFCLYTIYRHTPPKLSFSYTTNYR